MDLPIFKLRGSVTPEAMNDRNHRRFLRPLPLFRKDSLSVSRIMIVREEGTTIGGGAEVNGAEGERERTSDADTLMKPHSH